MRVQAKAVWVGSVAVAALALSGCEYFAGLQAKQSFKDANGLYQAQNYKAAAEKYEATVQGDPNITSAYFFLGNSYDNQFKSHLRGEAANDELLTKAIANYKLAVEKLVADTEQDKQLRKLSLQYLVAAYGPDKLNDPAQAEPVIRQLVELDPTDPANYFALSKIYEDAGDLEQAEGTLEKAREVRPNDSGVYMQLAGYYLRQGEFPKAIEALQQRAEREPNNPEAHYTIASYYWDKAYRDFRLTDNEKKDYIAKGIEAVNKALQIRADYIEAVTYKGLLLRLEANLEKNADRQKALLREAEELQGRAKELQKRKTEGLS